MATVHHADSEIAERIVARLSDEYERIAQDTLTAIVGEISAYEESDDARAVLADLRAHCEANIRAFLTNVQDGGVPAGNEAAFVEDAIVRRVRQGIPLDAILHAFRIGHQIVWSAIIDEAGRIPGGRAAAILLVQPSMRYIDDVSTRVADVYLSEQQRAVADADRIRRDALELLLSGSSAALGAVRAAGIDLDPQEPHHILHATLRPAAGTPQALQALADDIAGTFGRDALLVVVRHDTITALVRGPGTGDTERAAAIITRHEGTPGSAVRIGVGLATDDLAGLARAHEEAGSALRLTSDARPLLVLGEMPALDYLHAVADDTARRLVPAAVRALAVSASPTDAALVHTFDVYVLCGLNVQRTAAALPAHANTVHDRLRRLTERTGYDLRNVEHVMRLATELRLGAA